jgi:hypothetical protein
MVDLNKYLAEKYGLDLQGAEQQYQDQASSINTANLFSNLGDVIAGNRVGSNNAIFQQLNKQAKEDTIGRVKAEKEQMIADYDLNKKLKSDSDRNDKTSESAKFAQDSLVQVGFPPELVRNKSLNELESLSPYTKMIIDKQRQEQERKFKQEENQLKRQENQIKRQEQVKEKEIKLADLNAAQSKQLGNYKMGQLAEQQYQAATTGEEAFNPTKVGQLIDNSEWAPAWAKDEKANQAQAAMSSWVEVFLRDASGAAIPPSERMAYAQDYFPQPGDSQQVILNKAELRKQKMQNALQGAGRQAMSAQADEVPVQSPISPDAAAQELARRRQKKVVSNGRPE